MAITKITDKNMALLRAGVSPTSYGMRKGTQRHFNKKKAASLHGYVKHKGAGHLDHS
jgi:hypothetical protein